MDMISKIKIAEKVNAITYMTLLYGMLNILITQDFFSLDNIHEITQEIIEYAYYFYVNFENISQEEIQEIFSLLSNITDKSNEIAKDKIITAEDRDIIENMALKTIEIKTKYNKELDIDIDTEDYEKFEEDIENSFYSSFFGE